MNHFAEPGFGCVVRVGFDGVVSGYVWCIMRIAICGVQTGELVVDGAGFSKGAGKGGGVGFANGFAVPACAFGVEVFEHFLVGLAGPFEGGGEFCFFDFVVVVEEFVGLADDVAVVAWWGELVRVPGEVDVEGGDGDFIGVRGDDGDVAVVFGEDAGHCGVEGGGVDPVYCVHFLNKGALTDYSADKVQGEGRGVLPVAGHHLSDGNLLLFGLCTAKGVVGFLHPLFVRHCTFNHGTYGL